MFHHSYKETNTKGNKTRLFTGSNNYESIGQVMHKQMSLEKTLMFGKTKCNFFLKSQEVMSKYCH